MLLPAAAGYVLGLAASAVSAGTVAIPLRGQTVGASGDKAMWRRDAVVRVPTANIKARRGYLVQVGVGTPPQDQRLYLDTGVGDSWVNAADADFCQDRQLQHALGEECWPLFDAKASSTLQLVDEGGFKAAFLDGTQVNGDIIYDTVVLGGTPVTDMQLGVAHSTNRSSGVLGLGLRGELEAANPWPLVVERMLRQGLIRYPAYSIFLDDIDADAGAVLFGGIDTAKYQGKLAVLPLMPDPLSRGSGSGSNITSYTVRVEALGADGMALRRVSATATLDTGSTYMLMPQELALDLYHRFGVHHHTDSEVALVDCAWGGNRGEGIAVRFKFQGVTIAVPIRELVEDKFSRETQNVLIRDGGHDYSGWSGVCHFGIYPNPDLGIVADTMVLGLSFLRSAYVVFDPANARLGIAQASLGATDGSSVIEITEKGLPEIAGAGRLDFYSLEDSATPVPIAKGPYYNIDS